MVLHIGSDVSFLVAPRNKSRIAGYYHLPQPNKSIVKHVVTSAAEHETAGIFCNAQTTIPIQYILHEAGHPQPATPLAMYKYITEKLTKNNIT